MSSTPGLIGPSRSTPPGSFLLRPGYRALEAGVKHAMLAETALTTFGFYPNKRQKMAPVSNQRRRGTQKRKVTYKKKSSPTSVVKKAILGMAQTYHTGSSDAEINSTMIQNTLYTFNVTAQTAQSTQLAGRQGDQIYLIALKLKGSIFTPTTAGAYQYRIMVLMSGEEYNPATLGAGLANSELFIPDTAFNFNVHGHINSKSVTLLYDQRVDVNSTITGVSDVAQIDMNIPLTRKFEYQATGSVYGKKQNLYVVVTSVVGGGVSGTTATGQILMAADLVFKNL